MTFDARSLFEDNLPLIEEICAELCRRKSCFPPDSEDFGSQVKVALMADDFARLRRFKGRSSLESFLRAVVLNLFRDFRNQRWGRWRSSAEAKRRGETARQLERLLYRDGHTFDEAVGILRTNLKVELSEKELADLAGELPPRRQRRFEDPEVLEGIAVESEAESSLLRREAEDLQIKFREVLKSALEELDPEDRLVIKMRFEDGFTVTAISKVLRLDRRKLYGRFDRCLRTLRHRLESQGLRSRDLELPLE